AGGVYGRHALGAVHALPHAGRALQGLHQERLVVAAALFEVFGEAHRAHAHDAFAQRDQPVPAVLEAVDGDVARVFALTRADPAEVAEDRRRLVPGALALEFELAAHEGVAATRVDQVAGTEHQRLPVRARRMDLRRSAVFARVHALHPRAFPRVDAVGARVFEQQLVEFGAADLVGVVEFRRRS